MDITLTDRHREISAKARHYCDTYLLPLEIACDERDGLGGRRPRRGPARPSSRWS